MNAFYGKEKLYKTYLSEISGIKFTTREIDILSCVVHSRSNKRIAVLLSIAYRTVDAHIYNITSKIGKNSKDDIIEFAEKSGKLSYLKQYYTYIRIDTYFKKNLQKVAKTVTVDSIVYYVDNIIPLNSSENIDNGINARLQALKQDLKLANIILEQKAPDQSLHICLLKAKNSGSVNQEIGLLFDDIASLPSNNIDYIDFTSNTNYYLAVFDLIKKIVNKPELDAIRDEFTKEYNTVFENAVDIQVNEGNPVIGLPGYKIITALKKPITYCILALLMITLLVFIIYRANNTKNSVDSLVIQDFQKLMHEGLTASYITTENINTNYDLIKKVNKLLDQIGLDKPENYISTISSNELLVFLYNIHALSSYILYNEHNGNKARKLLTYAKDVAESYVNAGSKIKLHFEILSPEEVYTELSIVQDLPEMYTRITYLLGRTYLYQEDKQEAKKYFLLSQYLGNKLGLFEGYLSVISGLLIIKDKEISEELNKGDYNHAKSEINQSIETYRTFKNDTKEYKDNYQSKNKYDIIIPKNNYYNQVECSKHIIRLAGYLPDLQIILDELKSGLFIYLKDVPDKKVAALYNEIGFILLKAYDDNIDFSSVRPLISQELNINNNDNLEFLYQLFSFTEQKSRSTEYTKADSYSGLIEVYKRKIKASQNNDEKNRLQRLTDELVKKQDHINNTLNRGIK